MFNGLVAFVILPSLSVYVVIAYQRPDPAMSDLAITPPVTRKSYAHLSMAELMSVLGKFYNCLRRNIIARGWCILGNSR